MFSELVEKFDSNINGLRDFVDLIQPMLDEYHKNERRKHYDGIKPITLAAEIHFEDDEERKAELEKELSNIFEGKIEVVSKNLDENSEEEDDKTFTFRAEGDTSKIDKAFEFQVKSTEQKNLLYVNSLISLLSSAEWFYSQLLHFFYDENPGAAGIKKKTLTLEELKDFGSINDAEKYLIDSKIESLLRSSFSDWINTLKNELGLGLGYLDEFYDELIEIYQRRNLFVHNGGIVNSIYLSKVSDNYLKNIEQGKKLTVEEEYLDNAIDKVHILFSLIACELWKKNDSKDEDRSDFLLDLGYDYLKKGKWKIALFPNTFICNDAKQPVLLQNYAQLNCWLCKKRQGFDDDLKKELKKIDFSDKSSVLQLALFSIKDEKDKFFEKIGAAINSDELKVNQFLEFPIFDEMRDTDEYKEFISTNEKVIEYLNFEKNEGSE